MKEKVKPLISIVDDDESVREAVEALMNSVGFRAQTFVSAAEFLASDIENTSCLIADINMPHMSGVELYGRLTSLGYAVPTILITAYADDRVRKRALADGVICYLSKPFDDEALIECVRSAAK